MIIWVPIWFTIVILVTTLNKTLFTSLKCPYPLSITMIHMLSCAVYSTLMKYTAPNFFKYRPLKEGELRNLILVSVIFIVNIALSNSSLKFNSLALDQMFRCAMPVFTCVLEFIIYGKVRSLLVYLSLIPVILGTMLVCLGDIQGTIFGIVLLFISCTVSSLKGIITKYLLSGEEPISTFQLLNYNSMFAFCEIFPVTLINDRTFYTSWLPSAPVTSLLILVVHGMLAFALNIANFNAVKEGGPLMMNVVGNVKQVVMILLSVFMFGNKIKPIGIFGSVVCILGSMWYSFGGSVENRIMDRNYEVEQGGECCEGGREGQAP
ncbi:uncharacterized protein [Blastocystis hominis]|uniref:Sugar phosphate transporter domain-containing protein n=1 Tax=Blastocystis hominis TaxID=12968 RepID=D8M5G2_BLAHO|nr:uncharacterized protein [Blastocystis hominis]CBK23301.2 unnamed protein product [Blastocystis hominis]|eukprot:XP_012897349.1 uncharacterized protein [Blastocystis hominis]